MLQKISLQSFLLKYMKYFRDSVIGPRCKCHSEIVRKYWTQQGNKCTISENLINKNNNNITCMSGKFRSLQYFHPSFHAYETFTGEQEKFCSQNRKYPILYRRLSSGKIIPSFYTVIISDRYFRCLSYRHLVIPVEALCDRVINCPDFSDECQLKHHELFPLNN